MGPQPTAPSRGRPKTPKGHTLRIPTNGPKGLKDENFQWRVTIGLLTTEQEDRAPALPTSNSPHRIRSPLRRHRKRTTTTTWKKPILGSKRLTNKQPNFLLRTGDAGSVSQHTTLSFASSINLETWESSAPFKESRLFLLLAIQGLIVPVSR